jgi:DNA-binding XRE family transcriptional regulator
LAEKAHVIRMTIIGMEKGKSPSKELAFHQNTKWEIE